MQSSVPTAISLDPDDRRRPCFPISDSSSCTSSVVSDARLYSAGGMLCIQQGAWKRSEKTKGDVKRIHASIIGDDVANSTRT